MKSIIVADDSTIIQNIVEKIFSDEYTVLKASNGLEAISFLNNGMYNNDIVGILLDLAMPDYDGFYVLDYMKANNLFRKYPVTIISGNDSKDGIEKAFSYDILDMRNKPFNTDNIKTVVSKMSNSKIEY